MNTKFWICKDLKIDREIDKCLLVELDYNCIKDFEFWYSKENKHDIFFIIQDTIYSSNKFILVAQTLIDCDYANNKLSIYLTNTSNQVEYCKLISFTFYSFKKFYIAPNYRFPMFLYNHNEDKCEKINELKISTKYANGIDIQFENEYIIQPKGTLILNFNWFFEDLKDYPFLFKMRSRYAKLGCFLSNYNNNLMITNYSHDKITLGSRFIQLVLPNPFSFNLKNYYNQDLQLFSNSKLYENLFKIYNFNLNIDINNSTRKIKL